MKVEFLAKKDLCNVWKTTKKHDLVFYKDTFAFMHEDYVKVALDHFKF